MGDNVMFSEEELGEYFPHHILERGEDYFLEGRVVDLEHVGDRWIAEVEGSEIYHVEINLTEEHGIEDMMCDCPYSERADCKHMAAVCYAILEDLQESEGQEESSPDQEELRPLLERLTHNQLVSLLLEVGGRSSSLHAFILSAYPGPSQEVVEASLDNGIGMMIEDAFHALHAGSRYVSYRSYGEKGLPRPTADALESAFAKAEAALCGSRFHEAADIALLIIRKLADALLDLKDVDGVLLGVHERSETMLLDVCRHAVSHDQDQSKLFSLLFREARRSLYDQQPQWRNGLLGHCVTLCSDEEQYVSLSGYIGLLIRDTKKQGSRTWATPVRMEQMLVGLEYDLKRKFGTQDEVERYIEAHLDYPQVRRGAIERAMEAGDYQKADQLAVEGATKHTFGFFPSEDDEWTLARIRICEAQGDLEGKRKLMEQYLLREHSIEWFRRLKESFPEEDWPQARERLLQKIPSTRPSDIFGHESSFLADILREEGMLEELLDLVRKQPDLVFGYAGALVERYPRQIGEWYRNRIMLIAPDVSKRSQYQRLAERIGELARLGCVSDARQCLRECLAMHPYRHALKEELLKLSIL
jgi:hypothetical protein